MPKFRIISESDPTPIHRPSRGLDRPFDDKNIVTTIEALNMVAALQLIRQGDAAAHAGRRIVSIEEVHPGLRYTDDEITKAITTSEGEWTDEPMVDPEQLLEATSVYGDGDFIYIVSDIAEALRISGLVPGLHISLLQNGSGFIDYSMVEIHDDARGIYLARGCEIKHLTADRAAFGWDGALAIAHELIALSNDLH